MSSYSPALCQSSAGRISWVVAMRAPTISPLDDWLSLRARTHPDRPAIVAGGRTVSYEELDERAAGVARRLAALGVGEGDRVASALPPGVAFAELMPALPRLRAAPGCGFRGADARTAAARRRPGASEHARGAAADRRRAAGGLRAASRGRR